MVSSVIFYLIVGIIIFDYILDRLLDYLNSTRWNNELPKTLEGIYDAEKYKKQQDYEKTNHRFSLITDTFSFVLIMLMLLFSGFAFADHLARNIIEQPILTALVFFGILMFASDVLSTPFSVYNIFVIEEKFGFNKTTVRTFILDKIKGWLLTALLGGGILSLVIWFYQLTGEWFWMLAWAAVSLFMIFMAMFYSNLIVPLFNKQKPLAEGELKTAIEAFAEKTGYKLKNIYVIDGSKRSTKSNAYFTGLGAKKRIVLYDTLINDLTTNEIVGVLAHEIGHYKKKHTVTGIIISVLQTGLTLFILSLFIGSPVLCNALGAEKPSFHIGLIAFGILYSPLSMFIGLGLNYISRKNEFTADRFAAENYYSEALQNALKKLSVKSLSNLNPHPLYVFFHYSHPPLLERLCALKKPS
ncbi:MAG: M48 family metallopeptidase [Bacteroidia bacterium]|nr:M48 family metallopeptidase [Bacteroidia bacterium]